MSGKLLRWSSPRTEWQAQDAAAAVQIEWEEELPFVLSQQDAIKGTVPGH